MFQKKCDRCRKRSYGSDAAHRWVCPYCHRDITYVKARPPLASYGAINMSSEIHLVKEKMSEDSA